MSDLQLWMFARLKGGSFGLDIASVLYGPVA